LLDMFA